MSLFSINAGARCPKKRIPGHASRGYVALFPELTAFPRTISELNAAADPVVADVPGDTKKLGEAFAYETGGYHRTMGILVDTGDSANNSVGEVGSLMNEGIYRAFLEGDDDEVREWLDCLRDHSGCLQIVAPTKSGQTVSLGTPDYPVYLRSYTGGSGGGSGDAKIGYQLELYTGNPDTYQSIDLAAFPLGLTPAV